MNITIKLARLVLSKVKPAFAEARICKLFAQIVVFLVSAPSIYFRLNFFALVLSFIFIVSHLFVFISTEGAIRLFFFYSHYSLIHEKHKYPSAPRLLNHPPTRLQLGLSWSWKKEKKEEGEPVGMCVCFHICWTTMLDKNNWLLLSIRNLPTPTINLAKFDHYIDIGRALAKENIFGLRSWCRSREEGALELGTPQFESHLKVFDTFYVRFHAHLITYNYN